MPDAVMPSCGACGCENPAGTRFCESCGISLQDRCPNCSASVRAQQKFCGDCGHPLGVANAPRSRIRTPKHLTERILNARLADEGERKIATMLFADIAGSTALIRDLDIEEANRILDPALDTMIAAVHRYEGTITHTAGDGIMAMFGAPIAHEDHAARACYAALDVQEAMRNYATKVRDDFGLLVQVRIGINSGPVLVRVKHLEDEVSIEYRAVGVSTHVAARLESLAAPGTILVTRETLDLAVGFFRTGEFWSATVKGIADPLHVCELKGVNTRMRIQATASRGLSKFVGRQNEMSMLSRAAEQAKQGKGQVVALIGEAGVGKSRLFWEFTRSPDMQGWLVLEAGSVSYGKATSFRPLVDLLTRYFEIHARDDARRLRGKISGKLHSLEEKKLEGYTSLFLGALGMNPDDTAWATLAPAERQKQIFAALKQLLIRESQLQPLCVVFEDLHWIDPETQTFLDLLVESIPGGRLLLLVNFRADYESRWANKTYYSQAAIAPLPAESAEELLESLLGSNPELDALKRTLISATGGNALFLEESVRTCIESGVLTGAPGQWRPTGSVASVKIPNTVRALLDARIDRLEPELREILECAAVIGNDVPQALLEAVTGIPHDELEAAMRELQSAEFLYEKTLFPDTEYTFKHSMTREAAYGRLTRERRLRLHASAADALISLAGPRLDEHVERVAHHAEQGGLWGEAVKYLERAGSKALALYANAEAAAFYERAIGTLKHLPETHANLQRAVDLRFALRNALTPLGEIERILHCLDESEPILKLLDDGLRSAHHAAFRCNYHFLVGEQRRAIELGEIGLALARECKDRATEGELLYRVGQSYFALGEFRHAISLFEQSLEFTAEKGEGSPFELTVIPAVVSRTWLVKALTECGDFGRGMDHAKRALEIAEAAEHPLSQVLGWLAKGYLLLRKGENDGAIDAMERGRALCDQWTLRVWHLRLKSSLAVAYGRAGKREESLRLGREALESAQQIHLVADHAMVMVRLGQALLLCGNIDEAFDCGRRALAIAQAHEAKGDEAWARFLIGRACWLTPNGALGEGQTQFEQSLALALASDARPLAAFCHTMLGALLGRRGDPRAQALTALADAAYEELGMRALALDPVR